MRAADVYIHPSSKARTDAMWGCHFETPNLRDDELGLGLRDENR